MRIPVSVYAVVPKAKMVFAFGNCPQEFVQDFMMDVGHGDYYLASTLLLPRGKKFKTLTKQEAYHNGYSITDVKVIQTCESRMGRRHGMYWRCNGIHFELGRRRFPYRKMPPGCADHT